jgi:hypothetical protein
MYACSTDQPLPQRAAKGVLLPMHLYLPFFFRANNIISGGRELVQA